jgi:hypothetical protein
VSASTISGSIGSSRSVRRGLVALDGSPPEGAGGPVSTAESAKMDAAGASGACADEFDGGVEVGIAGD